MKMLSPTLLGSSCLLTILLLTACGGNEKTPPAVETKVKAATTAPAKEPVAKSEVPGTKLPEDGPSIATITAPAYVAKVHRSMAFIPENDGMGMMKVKKGHHFVVLDMSVRNTSKKQEVDMGQILLSTKVTDEKGNEYRLNPMAIAAYTLNNPDPQHQAQYNAMWSKLKPGDFYRTTVFGMEVPDGTKNFVLAMKEDGDIFKDSKRYTAKFSAE
ncbi:MAG TPA: hypothetical protein VFT06_02605 [Flavisolibacter sp.]|jgi:hypothetical protein|nr:hypothetical protein [Flavisolibacter sp.]